MLTKHARNFILSHASLKVALVVIGVIVFASAFSFLALERHSAAPSVSAQTPPSFDCAKAPYATNPACRGEHPRLHITKDTLPYFQNKVATDFKVEYQAFVKWVDANFNLEYHQNAGLMSDYHALIYLLGPIPGITYQRNISEYGKRAIEIMMAMVDGLISFRAEHIRPHDKTQLVVARTYDWMWEQLTLEQKTATVTWLTSKAEFALQDGISSANQTLFSSRYFEDVKPWYLGLAYYNDGIQNQSAQTFVDSFNTLMLNGKFLDAQNWAARHAGGTSEIGRYGLWHPALHILNIDGWRTATGENYFANGTSLANANFIRYYPQYLTYRLKPAEPTMVIKWGQMAPGDTMGEAGDTLRMLGEPLKGIDTNMAALNRWLLKRGNLEQPIYDWLIFLQILWGDKSVPARSPQDSNLPLTQYFEGIGMVAMRTGFEDVNDTAIVVGAPVYLMCGHDWGYYGTIPFGFTIDKYGPLAINRIAYPLSSSEKRENLMRFSDPLVTPIDDGLGRGMNCPNNIQQYTPNSKWYKVGITRLETVKDTGSYDYVYVDGTKNYLPERVKSYTRQYVYMRPHAVTDSDYIIIFDRTETTRPDIIKRWELNMAYNPQINGQEILVREGKWEYLGNPNEVTVTNDVDSDPYSGKTHSEAHGKLFVKTLLPQTVKATKTGGTGHEFENDAGVNAPNPSSDYNTMNKAGALFTGTYFVNVIPTVPSTRDNFLHVLQTADTNNPAQSSAMTPTDRIDGDTMVGAYIKDETQGYKVAMFSKTEANQTQATYTIPSTAKTIFHLLADLESNSSYTITQDATLLATKNSSNEGTLSFTSQGASTFQVLKVGEVANVPPVIASVSANPTGGTAPFIVSFTTVASDPDGSISSYAWNFGDGQTGTQQNPSHTYTTAGTFTATLTVTDNRGATAQKLVSITVTAGAPPPPPPPSIKPDITLTKSADKTSAQTGDTITYTITYQNIGQGDAINVVITDPIPEGTTYVTESATSNGAYDQTKNQLTWTISALAPNAKGSVSFGVRVE